MYLPGMAPSTEGAKIVIKPRTTWRERNLQSAQSPAAFVVPEKPAGEKMEPYRDSKNYQRKTFSIAKENSELEETNEKSKPVQASTVLDTTDDATVAKPNDSVVERMEKKAVLKKDVACVHFVHPSPRTVLPRVDHSEDEERIQELRNRLAAVALEKEVELKVIEQELQQAKLDMRRSINKEEAETLKEQMKCKSAQASDYCLEQLLNAAL